MKRLLFAAAAVALTPLVSAQTVIVDDNFDSYADLGAFEAVWSPDSGTGINPVSGPNAELIPSLNTTKFPTPNDNPAGLQVQAAGSVGGINELVGSYSLAPSASENIVLRGDIYTFTDGSTNTDETTGEITSTNNTRMSIGLRNDDIDRDPDTFGVQAGLNFFEMGFYNNSTCNPTVEGCSTAQIEDRPIDSPGYRQTSQFGIRLALFQFGSYDNWSLNGGPPAPLVTAPNYQYFDLDPALDLAINGGNEDGVVNMADIGADWHTYEAVFTETGLTVSLDLRRDGINNATGAPGVDATISLDVLLGEDPNNPGTIAAFNSLRFGGQSGIVSQTEAGEPQPGIFDNIYLALEEAGGPDPIAGDFNGDGAVDNGDLNLLLGSWGAGTVPPEWVNGFEAPVDNGELNALLGNWGFGVGAAIPEPTSAVLFALSAIGLAARRR